jgi:hypothetical protein
MDGGEGGEWVTYDRIAELRGCSRDGAVRWVSRHRYRKQPGNDGRVRVLVPPGAIPPVTPGAPSQDALPSGGQTVTPGATPGIAAAFEAALTTIREAHAGETAALREALAGEMTALRGQLGEAQALADTALAQLADAAAEANTLRDAIEGLRDKIARSEDQAGRADAARQEALQLGEELRRADEARKARGRLRRAWDGWRGR